MGRCMSLLNSKINIKTALKEGIDASIYPFFLMVSEQDIL